MPLLHSQRPTLRVEDLPRVPPRRVSELQNGHAHKSQFSFDSCEFGNGTNPKFSKTVPSSSSEVIKEFDLIENECDMSSDFESSPVYYPKIYAVLSHDSEIESFFNCLTSSEIRNTFCAIFLIFGLFLFYIGCSYFKDCPSEPSIPLFIILGALLLLVVSLGYIITKTSKTSCYIKYPSITNLVHKSFSACFVIWFIFGNIVVIFKHKTSEFRVIPIYVLDNCYPIVYWIAYSLLAFSYISVTCVFIVVLFLLIWHKCLYFKKLTCRRLKSGNLVNFEKSLDNQQSPNRNQVGQLLVNYNVCNYDNYGAFGPYPIKNEGSSCNRLNFYNQ